ncbi:MAG: YaeQ family protein [Steroidobacteraceae bacterium]
MALSATIHVFTVRLNDADRGVYQTLNLRIARHPSESAEFLVVRLFAYLLEYGEGIAFSRGLSEPDEPAIAIRDLTGVLQCWIDVGAPEAARLHKASKAAPRVVVYTHRDVEPLLARLAGERIHRAEHLRIEVIDRELLAAFVGRLERRMDLDLAVADRALYVTLGAETLTGTVTTRTLAP